MFSSAGRVGAQGCSSSNFQRGKFHRKNCVFSMTSPVTPGAVSLLVGMNINPRTPTKLPISPASAAAKAEKSAQRKREREAAVNNAAADQALQASEMTVAATSAAPALRAAAKKARHDRTQARVAAVQTEQAKTKAMPPPPVPGAQARAGSAKPKADAVRIKKKPKKAAAHPDTPDAEERAGSETGSVASSRAGNTKVGTTPPTTTSLLICSACSHRVQSPNHLEPHLHSQSTNHSPPLPPVDSTGIH